MAFPSWPDLTLDQLEQRQLALWKEEGLFRRAVDANREGPPFVFYEGPPTANGRPGIHHVFSRTIKDLVCRFQAMQGKSVTRIAGWDTPYPHAQEWDYFPGPSRVGRALLETVEL